MFLVGYELGYTTIDKTNIPIVLDIQLQKKSMVTTTRAARRKPGQIIGVTNKRNVPFAATAVKSNKWYQVSVPVAGGYLAKKEYYCLGNYRLKQQQQQEEFRLWRRSKRLFMICFLLFSSPVCLSVRLSDLCSFDWLNICINDEY